MLTWLVLAGSVVAAPSPFKAPIAHGKNGSIVGTYSPNFKQDFFLGVPFAQPPVGDLRFRQARPLNSTWEGVRDASKYADHCVGYGLDQTFYQASEDCLYLNIVRPAGYENKKLPVAFWIHGGTYLNGGGADQRYNLSFIVDQSVAIGKPVIGVSINYRLSLWGFTSSNELASEGALNLGLQDQRLALHWVQENIKAFGGDPKKVTIFGESAGAASVGFHLTAYGGRDDGLFRAAILQSGNPIFYIAQGGRNRTQQAFNSIISQVGCGNATSKVQCLRKVPFPILNATMSGNLSTTGGFNPVIDGDFTRDYGSRALSKGAFVKVPLIVGANSDEGASFSPYGINTTEQFKASLAPLPLPFQEAILNAYPDDLSTNVIAALGTQRPATIFGQQFRRVATYVGDNLFIAPRRQTAATWASHNISTYSYRFNADQAGFAPELAISHFKEIGFVFRNIEGVGWRPDIKPFEGKPQRYIDLAYFMSSTWASFVHDLDPNNWKHRPKGVKKWPKYSVEDPKNFVFDANVTSYAEKDTWRKEGIDLINRNALEVYQR
ncbi:alpha/beta-hydrolase [Plenodomus tracheiphilus IPT5]|uniref:Carboxylic ester hydrolase n=1 Tax=Plenodomus tracheiphilus IPT5 TaxID=1408161 RepID=A0A6A7BPC1_9PLEO|nr:alpha/beta-hydrolase [Plenodomus tracheiphilus IPT5]